MGNKINKNFITFSIEQRIIHHLMLHSKSLRSIGLSDGKMGIVILFMHLARNTGNDIYEDFANELIDEIWEGVGDNISVGISSGLSGIGFAIEYLLNNEFVEGDGLTICEEIDNKIMSLDPRRISDYSIDNGIGGLLYYILYHIKTCMEKSNLMPFDKAYLKDLFNAINAISKDSLEDKVLQLIICYNDFFENGIIPEYSYNMDFFISFIECFDEGKLLTYSMGLKNGLGGLLFTKMYQL